jgi:hypothetical protein
MLPKNHLNDSYQKYKKAIHAKGMFGFGVSIAEKAEAELRAVAQRSMENKSRQQCALQPQQIPQQKPSLAPTAVISQPQQVMEQKKSIDFDFENTSRQNSSLSATIWNCGNYYDVANSTN